jgi:threonyl-tRNA synthetase
VDNRNESIGKKIREAELMKVPVMVILGKQEVESSTVAVRTHPTSPSGLRGAGTNSVMPLNQLKQELVKQTLTRS